MSDAEQDIYAGGNNGPDLSGAPTSLPGSRDSLPSQTLPMMMGNEQQQQQPQQPQQPQQQPGAFPSGAQSDLREARPSSLGAAGASSDPFQMQQQAGQPEHNGGDSGIGEPAGGSYPAAPTTGNNNPSAAPTVAEKSDTADGAPPSSPLDSQQPWGGGSNAPASPVSGNGGTQPPVWGVDIGSQGQQAVAPEKPSPHQAEGGRGAPRPSETGQQPPPIWGVTSGGQQQTPPVAEHEATAGQPWSQAAQAASGSEAGDGGFRAGGPSSLASDTLRDPQGQQGQPAAGAEGGWGRSRDPIDGAGAARGPGQGEMPGASTFADPWSEGRQQQQQRPDQEQHGSRAAGGAGGAAAAAKGSGGSPPWAQQAPPPAQQQQQGQYAASPGSPYDRPQGQHSPYDQPTQSESWGSGGGGGGSGEPGRPSGLGQGSQPPQQGDPSQGGYRGGPQQWGSPSSPGNERGGDVGHPGRESPPPQRGMPDGGGPRGYGSPPGGWDKERAPPGPGGPQGMQGRGQGQEGYYGRDGYYGNPGGDPNVAPPRDDYGGYPAGSRALVRHTGGPPSGSMLEVREQVRCLFDAVLFALCCIQCAFQAEEYHP